MFNLLLPNLPNPAGSSPSLQAIFVITLADWLRTFQIMEGKIDKKDPCWKYARPDPNDKIAIICNFCGKKTKGGVFRAKKHLVGGSPDVTACLKCPPAVKEEIASFISQKAKEKEEKMSISLPDLDAYGLSEDDEGEDKDNALPKKRKTAAAKHSEGSTMKGPMDMFVKKAQKKMAARQTTINELTKKQLRRKVVKKIAR